MFSNKRSIYKTDRRGPIKINTAQVATVQLFNIVLSRWGIKKQMDSDQGSHFTGEIIYEPHKLLGIKQKFHTAYHRL